MQHAEASHGEYRERESLGDIATRLMAEHAERVNEAYTEPLLLNDGRLDKHVFQESAGGPYAPETIKADDRFVLEQELEWSDMEDPNVRAFHLKEYGIQTEGKDEATVTGELLAEWRERQYAHDGPLAEAAMTALLDAVIGDEFLVVRAADYDDYANGIDQHIIRRDTGETVFAFDEVTDTLHGSRAEGKYAKALRKARSGGATIRYGMTLRDGRPVKQTMHHVPVFALPIAKPELHRLLRDIVDHPGSPGTKELAVFDHLLLSLEEQYAALNHERLPDAVQQHLATVPSSLAAMRSLRSRFDLAEAA